VGNFERNIPIFLGNIDEEILQLSRDRHSLDWGHECDCEFCDRDQDIPEETEKAADEIDAKVKDLHLLKKRLVAHAKVHGIKLPEEHRP
jgi:hypothetical protein